MREQCVELARSIGRDADELVEWWAERAAIREVDGGQPRADAERDAFDDLRATFDARKGPRSADAAAAGVDARRKER